jgi:hypothetical protein
MDQEGTKMNACEENFAMTWAPVFWAAAGLSIALSLYVMQATWHDEINRRAPRWLQELRRIGFIVMALTLTNAILDYASQMSLLLVFGSGALSLAINAIALYLRSPPPANREGAYSSHRGYLESSYLESPEFDRLNRGQLYTHRLLEAILLNMDLEPDPAVIPNVVVKPKWPPRVRTAQ